MGYYMLKHNPFLNYSRWKNKAVSNPFCGPLLEAVTYDYINCSLVQEKVSVYNCEILPTYEFTSSFLVDILKSYLDKRSLDKYSSDKDSTVLDLGCGTGNGTRMLRRAFLGKIIGIDQSASMLEVAEYKFHQNENFNQELEQALNRVDEQLPERLREYWDTFRCETVDNDVTFLQHDIRTLDLQCLNEERQASAAISNHALHWVHEDWPQTFTSIAGVLQNGAPLIWTTASDFVDSRQFPSEKYSWRYSTLIEMVGEKLQERGFDVKSYLTLRKPIYTEDEVKEIVDQNGFLCTIHTPILNPKDLRYILDFYLPLAIQGLINTEIDAVELVVLNREIVSSLIRERDNVFTDLQHKYDVNPVFVCIKK